MYTIRRHLKGAEKGNKRRVNARDEKEKKELNTRTKKRRLSACQMLIWGPPGLIHEKN